MSFFLIINDRALIRSMSEILFLCGSNKRAVIATLSVTGKELEGAADGSKDEVGDRLVFHVLLRQQYRF